MKWFWPENQDWFESSVVVGIEAGAQGALGMAIKSPDYEHSEAEVWIGVLLDSVMLRGSGCLRFESIKKFRDSIKKAGAISVLQDDEGFFNITIDQRQKFDPLLGLFIRSTLPYANEPKTESGSSFQISPNIKLVEFDSLFIFLDDVCDLLV